MSDYLKRRAREKSTYIGLGTLVAGLGALFGFPETGAAIGQSLGSAAGDLASGNYVGAFIPILGALSIFLPERGQ